MVRDAGVVRTAAAQERPAVDDQLASAHGAQIGRAEAAGRAAADEDRVEFAAVVGIDVEDSLGSAGLRQPLLDRYTPLFDRQSTVTNVPNSFAVQHRAMTSPADGRLILQFAERPPVRLSPLSYPQQGHPPPCFSSQGWRSGVASDAGAARRLPHCEHTHSRGGSVWAMTIPLKRCSQSGQYRV